MATGTRPPADRTSQRGAYSAGDDGGGHRKRGAWLWWLLGLLALALLVALLAGLLGGDDDGERQAAQPTPTTQTGASSDANPGGAAGTLTARGDSLLPVPAGGLAGYETETATGQEVVVQSVVKDEGFWVGTSAQDRVYVEYGGDVGADENQGTEPSVGDKVDLTGEMRPAPQDPARTLNLSDQDAQQVSRQRAYVNATQVKIR